MFLCTVSSLFFGTGFGVSYSMYKSNIDATILQFSQCDRQTALVSKWFEKTTEEQIHVLYS